MISEDKAKAMETAKSQLEKKFGAGVLLQFNQNCVQKIPTISSGSLQLDLALGCGGYPCGRISEIYGPESSGKTSLCLHAIAECQKAGGTAAFIDAEHALDINYAQTIGVDIQNLWLAQPDYGEQALEIANILVLNQAVSLVVIDSVAALIPQAEFNSEMGEQFVGLQARMMSQALRKLSGSVAKSKAAIIFTNQIRSKVGVVYGHTETTTGGLALKFYATLRLEVKRGEILSSENQNIGCKVKIRVLKNKLAPPFRKIELDLFFGQGISSMSELLEVALQHNLIKRAGSWFSWAEENNIGEGRIAQGRDNARHYLEQNPQLAEKLENELREKLL